ncbi:Kelch repeat-containing protein [Holophaga foetida]|uniref:Kelch repeat-containing protein n=1 Tax=Holophaga foetida TaxID=35839 RepID=UPI0002471C1D|nr:kelch repeat-containing protein [Holophaga foetida]
MPFRRAVSFLLFLLALLSAACGGGGGGASSNTVHPPTDLIYSSNPATYTKGVAITPNAPSYSGDRTTGYSISPSIPAGLTFDTSTGLISGAPSSVVPQNTYTVTACNAAGCCSTGLTITINDEAPADLSYQFDNAIYLAGVAIENNYPSSTGGAVALYTVSPNLPAGLSLNSANGLISGTPTTTTGQTVYRITASNTSGSSYCDISITVNSSQTGAFSYTGSLTVDRGYHTATLLNSGKVLITGGYSYDTNKVLSSAELYDPSTGLFSATGSMQTPRQHHTATLLTDGKVLVTGGTNGYAVNVASAEIYDPASGTFSSINAMTDARAYHSATLMANGNVLLVGGQNTSTVLATAEVYTPGSGTFTATGSLHTTSMSHSACLLSSGKVFIYAAWQSEVYDPSTGAFTTVETFRSCNIFAASVRLQNGAVLLPGGDYVGATVKTFDPGTSTVSTVNPMTYARSLHTATLLPTGDVLITGGQYSLNLWSSAEIYSASLGTFSLTGSMKIARTAHTATLLPNGMVLIVGGFGESSCEVYRP